MRQEPSDRVKPLPEHPQPQVCANCGTHFGGHYCPHCGQDAHIKVPTAAKFLNDLVEKYFGVEDRLPLTLRLLFLRPGQMTVDYLEGRRQRYISPLRLYLAASVLFFVALSFVPGLAVDIGASGVEITTLAVRESSITAHTGIAAIDTRVARFMMLSLDARSHVLRDGMIRSAPQALLLLIPLFAALLKLLYRRRLYGEHLLFALHFHTLAFLLLPIGLVPWPQPLHDIVNNGLNLLLAGVLLLMLRRVYGGGWAVTLARLVTILATYALALAGVALAAVLLAVGV